MATFVSTTLTKRTGATTTVFSPMEKPGEIGYLRESAASANFGRYVTMSQRYNNGIRRTRVQAVIPQLDADGLMISRRALGSIELLIPDGMLVTEIDDLVGYLNSLTASSLTNFDDLLVNGFGVY